MPQGQYQQPQSQFICQGQYQPQLQYTPQSQYQSQGQYSAQYVQPPLGQPLQGSGNIPVNYQPYVQSGYGPQYIQPSMNQIPEISPVWDPSQV